MAGTPGAMVHTAVNWILAALLLWLGLRWFERLNMYFPSRTIQVTPLAYGIKWEELSLQASDGPVINGWYVEDKPESPVMLVSHGNGGNIGSRVDKLLIFRRAGASVLMYDYRGYGRSTGSPTEQGTYLDAEAAYAWLTEVKKVPPGRIVFYGESLGAGVAVEMALRHEAAGLVVDSGFTSTVDMGKTIFPFLPIQWMVRFRYDNLAKIPHVKCPVLVTHSPQDDIVPYKMGRRLFEAAPEPKVFFEMKGDHNEGFVDTGKPYEEAVRRFLESLRKKR